MRKSLSVPAHKITVKNLRAGHDISIGAISISDTSQIAAGYREALKQVQNLASRLAVSRETVLTFLRTVGEEKVPKGNEGKALIDAAARYKLLEEKVQLLEASDPQTPSIRREVEFALAQGNLELASNLLTAAVCQIEGVVRVRDGRLDEAFKLLGQSVKILEPLAKSNPKFSGLILQIGYTLKTQAQAIRESNKPEQYAALLKEAEQRFRTVAVDVPPTEKTVADLASAVNGLANVASMRGDARTAIEYGEFAVALLPSYAYAWHDLLGAYMMLVQTGDAQSEKMLQALGRLKETSAGYPGLDPAYLNSLEQSVKGLAAKRVESRP